VLGTTISTASHHLRKMRDLKLLKYRNNSRMACYSLRSELAGKLAADGIISPLPHTSSPLKSFH
jgi:hypothetical protein